MGKSWKNPAKVENANKKGAVISKLSREIIVSVKLGGPDPEGNSRLRMAIDAAKEASVPKDTIERAIKKGSGQGDDNSIIEEVLYEGFGPHQVGILVECQTDNRTRTAPDIRFIFKKHDGLMGEQGSVAWMFDRVAYVEATHSDANVDGETEAIEAGANDVVKNEDGSFAFYGNPDDLSEMHKALLARGWQIKTSELSYKNKNKTDLNEEQLKEVHELLDALDDNDDTSRIHTTLE
jgi:YebC/PmpR family DNA-binding regulatory protein